MNRGSSRAITAREDPHSDHSNLPAWCKWVRPRAPAPPGSEECRHEQGRQQRGQKAFPSSSTARGSFVSLARPHLTSDSVLPGLAPRGRCRVFGEVSTIGPPFPFTPSAPGRRQRRAPHSADAKRGLYGGFRAPVLPPRFVRPRPPAGPFTGARKAAGRTGAASWPGPPYPLRPAAPCPLAPAPACSPARPRAGRVPPRGRGRGSLPCALLFDPRTSYATTGAAVRPPPVLPSRRAGASGPGPAGRDHAKTPEGGARAEVSGNLTERAGFEHHAGLPSQPPSAAANASWPTFTERHPVGSERTGRAKVPGPTTNNPRPFARARPAYRGAQQVTPGRPTNLAETSPYASPTSRPEVPAKTSKLRYPTPRKTLFGRYRGAEQTVPGSLASLTGAPDKNYRGARQKLPGRPTKTTGAPDKNYRGARQASPEKSLQVGMFFCVWGRSPVLLLLGCCLLNNNREGMEGQGGSGSG
ncbi:MAG: hypothetical protein AVDCRST_MAG01-01-4954 [uncultured Rubrobacteraceae bacterium]|uniref:Uncharacterized protein n=1 Tax=uncultured Rubrobacteraceae bacterium TaxID=349277 RepID=A0A6J4QWA6_9ACTN|nr:MAG: hypothetical protein AVDCRST_MAG01-01-4954 [uncultured Rubrobacteraceae bacterium]